MTYQAAVLGSPIAHSLSPQLHLAAYRHLGLDWEYSAIECTDVEFPDFLATADDQWMGMSLTMPLKEVVLQVVDATEVEEAALAVGSANTLHRAEARPGAPWRAANTDIVGMTRALQEAGVERIDSAVLLGAGATARSALAALADLGATSVEVHARRPQARAEMAEVGERLGSAVTTADFTPCPVHADVLVSTLPANAAQPWARVDAPPEAALLDASYHPWPTPLAAAWSELRPHAPRASGRGMLLWQAVAQVGLMTGIFSARLTGEDTTMLGVAGTMRAAIAD